jgi:hypothetical protein
VFGRVWPRSNRQRVASIYRADNAIKFTDDADVAEGLHVATNVEQGIAALNSGLRPLWVVVGANALANFPLLGGIDALTIIADDAQAVAAVAARWTNAGHELIVVPKAEPPRDVQSRDGPP